MMIRQHLDPTRFSATGCIIDWAQVAATRDPDDPVKLAAELQRLGLTRRMTHLRWSLNPGTGHPDGPMGMPGGPFHVMRREAHLEVPGPRIDFTRVELGPGITALVLEGTMARVWLRSMPTASGPCTVYGICGTPESTSVTTMATLPANTEIVLSGASLIGILIYSPVFIPLEAKGIGAQSYADGFLSDEEFEMVGLPVDPADWTGPVATMAAKQGFWGQETDPRSAAQDRLRRAAMLWGWDRRLEGDVLAPPWTAPDSAALVSEMNEKLLPLLRSVFAGHSSTHAAATATVPLPPPTNSQGQPIPGAESSDAQVSPFAMLLSAVATDPHLAVALGFGTAFDTVDAFVLPQEPPPPPPKVPKIATDRPAPASAASTWQGPYDYLIVADYFDQKTSQELPFDSYAALVMDPQPAIHSAGPANVHAEAGGLNRPAVADGPWSATARVAWDRLPRNAMLRPAGFAACRRTMPSAAAVPLMETRSSGGFAPIAANGYGESVAGDPAADQVSVVDRALTLPAADTSVTGRYYVAQQDLFGRWSHWAAANLQVGHPPPDNAHLVSATLTASLPALPTDPTAKRPTSCPATLTVDFTWDWSVRTPRRVRLVGRLYPAATRGAAPVDVSLPNGFGRSIGSGGAPIDVYFSGDTAAVRPTETGTPEAGTSVEYLNEDGTGIVPAGPGQGSSRRYRVHIPGFTADFTGTAHVGVAIWAQGTERVPPNRDSGFDADPLLTTVSNPIPPAIASEQVDLAGLPDAAGNCHARIAWTVPQGAGATGYFLYTATESAMRDARGKGVAAADETLATRKTLLKTLFAANPSRREFTRVNSTPIPAAFNRADVTLPRGSSDIHVYVAVATTGGNVESRWPTSADQLVMVAAPRVTVPAAPTLEVKVPGGDAAAVEVTIAARAGARVSRFDLHRVRVPDAARELDTMGPPATTITDGAAGWHTTRSPGPGQPLQAQGQDQPGGSWRKVFYRAVAWAQDDLPRGSYGSRSPASLAVAVVLPPPGPPDLSAVTVQPATGAADVLLQWTSTAPIEPTALGPHRLIVEVVPLSGQAAASLFVSAELQTVNTVGPAPGASGIFRDADPNGIVTRYRAVLRRSSINEGLSIAVRIRDPLGRTAEQLLTVPAGPDPDITAVQVGAVADLGVVLRWTTSAPLTEIGGLFYRVRVTATPPSVGGVKPRPVSVELPMNLIPQEAPPGTQPLVLQRTGKVVPAQLRAVSTAAVAAFTVRITAPDGRFAELTKKVS